MVLNFVQKQNKNVCKSFKHLGSTKYTYINECNLIHYSEKFGLVLFQMYFRHFPQQKILCRTFPRQTLLSASMFLLDSVFLCNV